MYWHKGSRSIFGSVGAVAIRTRDVLARIGKPTAAELEAVLVGAGFSQIIRRMFARAPNNRGTYWDIVWKQVEPGLPLNERG